MRIVHPSSRRGVARAAAAALFACLLASAPFARASSTGAYLDTIPNGNVISCQGCHDDSITGTLNSFGNAIYATLDAPVDAGGFPDWAQVRGVDSDGDGQSNGQELGDPCSTWQVGQPAPRATAISNPGLAASLSPTPNEPPCEAQDDGGCRVAIGDTSLSLAAAALLALGLALPIRRRRSTR